MKSPVAILNLTRMGDILMTGPMIDRAKELNPGCEVHLIVVDGFKIIAEGLHADKVIPLDYDSLTTLAVRANSNSGGESYAALHGKFREMLHPLLETEYSAIYNISHTRISAVITALMKGEVRGGLTLDSEGFRSIKGRWSKAWFSGNLNRGINPFHLVDMNIGIAGSRSGLNGQAKISYSPGKHAKAELETILKENGINENETLVAFQVGASSDDKRWEAEKFVAVARNLAERRAIVPVFVGTEQESSLLPNGVVSAGARAVSLFGKTSLPVLAELLGRCDLLITNDTGTMHLAQAVDTRSVVITLGSALSDETGPYGVGNIIIEPTISCFPCDFKVKCPHFNCHLDIDPQLVTEIAVTMLDGREIDLSSIHKVESESVAIWRTEFDYDGWWRKGSLSPVRMNDSALIRELYRELLKADLEPNIRPEGAIADNVLYAWQRLFGEENLAQADGILSGQLKRSAELVKLASEGVLLAERILVLLESRPDALKEIARHGDRLSEIDELLLKEYLAAPLWRPALAMFRFDLENLPEKGIAEQTVATADLHRTLLRRIEGITSLTGAVLASNKKQKTGIENTLQGSIPAGNSVLYGSNGTGSKLSRSRMRTDKHTILLPVNGYYLQQEIASTLSNMGHKVIPLPFEGRDDFIQKLLEFSLQADMLITVNHLGFDREGELATILHDIGLPYASWYVDRPGYILLDHETGPTDLAWIATWEKQTVQELRQYGFDRVDYLPLATDDRRFKLKGPQSGEGALRFVANSMITASREWQEKARRFDGDPLLDDAVRHQIEHGLDPEDTLLAVTMQRGVNLDFWERREVLETASAIALTATRDKRHALVHALEPAGLHLYGDSGWQSAAPSIPYHGPVQYPRGLAEVYRNSTHVNMTSFQMPTAVNQRVFDVPAAGGILLTDAKESMSDLFDVEKECITFESIEEAVDQAKWISLNDEAARKRMVKAQERILNEHTYRHRLQNLIDGIGSVMKKASVPVAGGLE